MGVFKIGAILLVYLMILLIDKPKLDAEPDKKYRAAYAAVAAFGFLLGILVLFQLIPTFNQTAIAIFKKLSGG